jgi:metallophosphoesterase (TIGR00282 family)
MKILFIGDIVGKIGRQAVCKIVPKLRRELKLDLVIANAENAAHGSGITEKIVKELLAAKIDAFTAGDHAFSKTKQLNIYDNYPLIRPSNFSDQAPGQGHMLIPVALSSRSKAKNSYVLLISLIGRVFMKKDHNCPFAELNEILANIDLPSKNLSAIIVDMHAEATSEKVSFGYWADGRVSAVLGTHTHIMTADHKITPAGTAYITDVGMVGAAHSCLGVDKENIIKTFLTQIRYPHVIPEKGQAIFNAVLLTINPKNRQASQIKPITKFINIS